MNHWCLNTESQQTLRPSRMGVWCLCATPYIKHNVSSYIHTNCTVHQWSVNIQAKVYSFPYFVFFHCPSLGGVWVLVNSDLTSKLSAILGPTLHHVVQTTAQINETFVKMFFKTASPSLITSMLTFSLKSDLDIGARSQLYWKKENEAEVLMELKIENTD